jgi:hypothetical protein
MVNAGPEYGESTCHEVYYDQWCYKNKSRVGNNAWGGIASKYRAETEKRLER